MLRETRGLLPAWRNLSPPPPPLPFFSPFFFNSAAGDEVEGFLSGEEYEWGGPGVIEPQVLNLLALLVQTYKY